MLKVASYNQSFCTTFKSRDGDLRRRWRMEKLGEGGSGCGDNVRESWSTSSIILPTSPPTRDLKLIEDISFKLPHLHCNKNNKRTIKEGISRD